MAGSSRKLGRTSTGLGIFLTALALSGSARAEAEPGNALDACAQYRESMQFQVSADSYLALATCEEKLGHNASAWVAARRALELADASTEVDAAARAAEQRLSTVLTRLEIHAPVPTPADLVIELDGEPLASARYGEAIPVDPGAHHVSASAPGRQRWTLELTLPRAAETTALHIPALPHLALPPAPTEALPTPRSESTKESSASPWNTQRTVGLVLGSIGATALGAGIVLAVNTSDRIERFDERCAEGICDANLRDDFESIRTRARASNILLGTGLVSLASSVVVYLLAPSSKPKTNPNVRISSAISSDHLELSASGQF